MQVMKAAVTGSSREMYNKHKQYLYVLHSKHKANLEPERNQVIALRWNKAKTCDSTETGNRLDHFTHMLVILLL